MWTGPDVWTEVTSLLEKHENIPHMLVRPIEKPRLAGHNILRKMKEKLSTLDKMVIHDHINSLECCLGWYPILLKIYKSIGEI